MMIMSTQYLLFATTFIYLFIIKSYTQYKTDRMVRAIYKKEWHKSEVKVK